jgi:hypothetical protein
MEKRTRVILTVALGIVLGVWFWLDRQEPSPYALVHSTPFQAFFLASIFFVPLIVRRWWVVSALAGPLAFLAFWQATGHHVYADGQAPPLNVESIASLIWLALWLWLLVAVRMAWDGLQRRWHGRSQRSPNL